MDPLEELLSPEALRLLLDSDDFATTIDQPSVSASDQSLSLTTPLATAVDIPSIEESKPTRKRLASDANIPGCSTLVLDKASSAKRKRTKFSAEGRAKVASVRKKGACMKCHLDKISCSGEWPCESCCRRRAIIAGRASRHKWMDCIPFSIKDLDIFASEFVQKFPLIDELLDRLIEFNPVHFVVIWLGEAGFNLTMKSDLSLDSLTFDSSRISSGPPSSDQWILHSKVPLAHHIDSRLEKSFQILAATWLIEQTIVEDTLNGDNFPGLHYAQSVAGSKLLQCLEKTLSSSFLSKSGADTLDALIRILIVTLSVVVSLERRFHSPLEFRDRQQQLVRVLAHHMLYIGERLHCFESVDKEEFIKNIASHENIASHRCIASRVRLFTPGLFTALPQKSELRPNARNNFIHGYHSHWPRGHSKPDDFSNQYVMAAANTIRGPTKRRDQPREKTSEATPLALDQRKGDISQPTLYMKADAVSEPKNGCVIVQRHATAKPLYLADSQPEDSRLTFGDHDETDPSISTSTGVFLPGFQPDTVCSWCGCLQFSYKPSQGVVSCDDCFTPYQPNDLAAAGSGLEEHRSTELSFHPPSGLNDFQADLVNHAPRPEVTTSSSFGNDLDDLSWFMAS